MKRSASCRDRRELSNEYSVGKTGFDKAEKEPWQVCPLKMSKSRKCFDTLAASCTLILCLLFFLLHQFAICENLHPVAESPPAEWQAGTLRYTRVARAVENSPLPRDNPDWIRLDQASLHAAARKKIVIPYVILLYAIHVPCPWSTAHFHEHIFSELFEAIS